MRLLTPILLSGLLFTALVTSGYTHNSTLQQTTLTALNSASSHQLVVKGGYPGHRGSGRLESYEWAERSLG